MATPAPSSRPRPQQRRFHKKPITQAQNGIKTETVSQAAPPPPHQQQTTTAAASTVSTHLSNVRFDSLQGRVDPFLLSAIPFPVMSEVQAATLEPALSGADVLAQAKTGTGKTVAFLLPTINRLLSARLQDKQISSLIMSPTRELALQIEKEANMLLKNVGGRLGVQHVVGGTNMKSEERNLASKRCDILVATPGRLLDHLNNTPGMADKFKGLQVYILDEADRMLDMGFRQELAKIQKFLPDRKSKPRQTLLFSATIPDNIRDFADLDANAHFINTLSEEEANTHAHVPQQHLVTPSMSELFPLTPALMLEEIERAPSTAKIIVFSPTARAAGLSAEVFRSAAVRRLLDPNFTVGEVHSRRSQPQRVKATQEFAQSRTGVLFSSDVAARGVDFPGVTCVLQVGLPASPEQYIHRIGRTGRAGAQGRGVIILADFESYFLGKREMRELPLSAHPGVPADMLDAARQAVSQALLHDVSDESKAQSYQASLGYYKSELRSLKWSPQELVQKMNDYAREALLYAGGQGNTPPPLLAKTVGKMGMKGVPGLNVVRELGGRPDGQQQQSRGQGRPAFQGNNGQGRPGQGGAGGGNGARRPPGSGMGGGEGGQNGQGRGPKPNPAKRARKGPSQQA